MQTHDEPDLVNSPPRRSAQAKAHESVDVARAVAEPTNASAASLLELQRLAGNATVSRMLAPAEEEPSAERSPVLDVVGKGGGSPLDSGLRSEMEARLGGDFGDVKVHHDAKASESTQAVQANAYTVGNEVVFRSDQWAPGSDSGKETLAHELTHVMQQRAGPVAGTEVGGGIKLSHPADEFETAADQNARAALAAPAPVGPGKGGGATAQRQEEELPEEEVQGAFVQRQAEEEELPEEEVQGAFVQRQAEEEKLPEEEVPVQGDFVQRQTEQEQEEEEVPM